jgi:ubiquinone/menaquinone biosynthesis C-methylase UbiE
MKPEEYPKLAAVEDQMWYFRSLHAHIEGALRRALRHGRSADVLDAGCGTGGLVVRLRPRHPDWSFSAGDLSPIACEIARSRTGLDVRECDVENLPWAEQSFDAVVSANVLSHLESPQKALSEAYRVLRPGALLVLNVPAYPWLWSHHDDQQQVRRRFTRAELRAALVAAGFRGVQLTHWTALPFPALWFRRKFMKADPLASEWRMQPWPIEMALRGAMHLEHAWLDFGGRWSWGSSLFAVARKPLAEERL